MSLNLLDQFFLKNFKIEFFTKSLNEEKVFYRFIFSLRKTDKIKLERFLSFGNYGLSSLIKDEGLFQAFIDSSNKIIEDVKMSQIIITDDAYEEKIQKIINMQKELKEQGYKESEIDYKILEAENEIKQEMIQSEEDLTFSYKDSYEITSKWAVYVSLSQKIKTEMLLLKKK